MVTEFADASAARSCCAMLVPSRPMATPRLNKGKASHFLIEFLRLCGRHLELQLMGHVPRTQSGATSGPSSVKARRELDVSRRRLAVGARRGEEPGWQAG